MMRDLLIKRIKELKELEKERNIYNNICNSQIDGSFNLQQSLSILQKPTIKAISKLTSETTPTNPTEKISKSSISIISLEKEVEKIEKEISESHSIEKEIEKKVEPENVEESVEEKVIEFLSDEKIYPLKINLPKKFYLNYITKSLKPVVSFIEINEENFLEIKIKTNKLYFYERDKNYYFLIFDFLDKSINEYPFNKLIIDLFFGDVDLEKNYSFAEKKYIHIYLDLVGANTRNSNYCKKLKEIAGVRKLKEKKYTTGKGVNNPVEIFEKLTLLISAVKAGHDNLEEEIKMVCKKLKIDNLITKEVYEKYKNKYFKK